MDSVPSFAQLLESMSRQEDTINPETGWLLDNSHKDGAIRASAASGFSIGASNSINSMQKCETNVKGRKQNAPQDVQVGDSTAGDSSRLSSGSTLSAPISSATDVPGSDTVDELVDQLKHQYSNSKATNNIGAAIIKHPDLMTNTSALKVYSKLNGGLKDASPGTAHAWLYTPKKRKRARSHNGNLDSALDCTALVLVYPENLGPSCSTDDDSKNTFHFGGRAHTFRNGSDGCVRIQHGSCRALGCVNDALPQQLRQICLLQG